MCILNAECNSEFYPECRLCFDCRMCSDRRICSRCRMCSHCRVEQTYTTTLSLSLSLTHTHTHNTHQTLGVSWAFACYNERCFTGRHQRRAHLDSPKFPAKFPRNYLLPGRVLVLGNGERWFERIDTLVECGMAWRRCMSTVFALEHSADGLQRGLGRSGRCAKSTNGSAGARKHRPWRLGSSTRSTRNTSPRSKPTCTKAGPLTLPHAPFQSGTLSLTARNGCSSPMRAAGSGCVSMQCSTGPWRRGTR